MVIVYWCREHFINVDTNGNRHSTSHYASLYISRSDTVIISTYCTGLWKSFVEHEHVCTLLHIKRRKRK